MPSRRTPTRLARHLKMGRRRPPATVDPDEASSPDAEVAGASERERAEAALRESEARYRTFLALSQEGIWRFELDEPISTDLPAEEQVNLMFTRGWLAECNAAFARMYGFETPEELVGARLTDFVPPDDPSNRAFLHAFIANEYQLNDAESHEVDREGRPRVISNTLTGYLEDGMIIRAWGTQRDVTERVATQNALRASEERFRLAASNEAVTLFEQDEALRYTWVYPQHPEFPDANIGRTDAELVPEEASSRLTIPKQQVIETGIATRQEIEVPLPSGMRWYDIVVEPRRDESGRVVGVAGIALDVTSRRKAEGALRESERRYRTALDATVGIVYEWDLTTGHTERSEGLRDLLGYDPVEVPSTRTWWTERVHPDDRQSLPGARHPLAELGTDRIESEYRVQHRDGRWIDVLDRAVVVRDDAGRPARVVGHTTDITERRRGERHRTFLAALDTALRLARTPEEVLSATLDGLPETLGVTRCTYGEVDAAADRITVSYGVGSTALPNGTALAFSAFVGPTFRAEVEAGRPVVVSDVATDPRTRLRSEAISRAGAAVALLVVPVLREGRWVAALAVASDVAREWTADEVALVEAVAARVAPALERSRAEEALRESETRFRVLGEALPLIVSLAGPEGEAVYVNPYWEAFSGRPAAAFLDGGHREAIHPEDRARVAQVLQEAIGEARAYEYEYRLRAADGTYRWLLARGLPVRGPNGEVAHWVNIAADIHARKEAEAALVASERQLRVVTDAMPALIAYVDAGHYYRFANRAYFQWFGTDPADFVGRHVRDVIGPAAYELVLPEIETALEGRAVTYERLLPYREGGPRFVRGTLIPDVGEGGSVRGYFALILDVTDEHRREDELREANEALAEANETLEARVFERTVEMRRYQDRLRALLSRLGRAEQLERQRLAAELHDHLAQVLTGARLLLSSVEVDVQNTLRAAGGAPSSPPTLARLQELLQEALRHTRALMDDLSPPPALQQDDLVAAIRWVVEAAEKMGLRVTVEGDAHSLPLEREVITVIYQSVRELLQNVHKHARTTEARVSVEKRNGHALIVVTDAGGGFQPAAAQPRPGDEGGFGLFHLRERLALIGGHFELHSAPGEGTRALLEVPLAPQATALADDEHASDRPPGGSPHAGPIRVLLVDDHRVVREALRTVIEEQPDMTVVGEASDGTQAVEAARELTPDVVLMDVSMPGMNGVEATSRIVSESPQVHVVGLSMHEEEAIWAALRDAGAKAYVTKAEAFETLGNTIRVAVRGDHAGGKAPTRREDAR